MSWIDRANFLHQDGVRLTELSSACALDPTLNTFFFAFDPPNDLTQIRAPVINPGESICRSLLKSTYSDDVYFQKWYDGAKDTNTIPVYAYTTGFGPSQKTYVVAVVDRPGVTLQRIHDGHVDESVLQSLKNHVGARVFRAEEPRDDVPVYSPPSYIPEPSFAPGPPPNYLDYSGRSSVPSPPPMYRPLYEPRSTLSPLQSPLQSPSQSPSLIPPNYTPTYGPTHASSSSSNRVLVVCQRSSSEGADREIVSRSVAELERFVRERVENPVLEFMTPGLKSGQSFGADYKFALTLDPLSKDFEKSLQFIKQNEGQYAAVVLHTCPYLFTLQVIPAMSTLLRKDGTMFWTTSAGDRQSVTLLPQTTFDRVISRFNKDHGDRWHFNFKDFRAISPGLFVKV